MPIPLYTLSGFPSSLPISLDLPVLDSYTLALLPPITTLKSSAFWLAELLRPARVRTVARPMVGAGAGAYSTSDSGPLTHQLEPMEPGPALHLPLCRPPPT